MMTPQSFSTNRPTLPAPVPPPVSWATPCQFPLKVNDGAKHRTHGDYLSSDCSQATLEDSIGQGWPSGERQHLDRPSVRRTPRSAASLHLGPGSSAASSCSAAALSS